MKILYFSDGYAEEVMGTKISVAKEIASRGHEVNIKPYKQAKNNALSLVNSVNPDVIFLVRAEVTIDPQIKKRIKVPVVGFDFGGVGGRTVEVINDSYDLYITAHYKTFLKHEGGRVPIHYNPPACDFRFHKKIDLEKDIDMSMIGHKVHPSFHNKNIRGEIIKRLKTDLPNYTLRAFGSGWGGKYIVGQKFLNVINRSKIGLDVMEDWRPLAHRMFEYGACGVPVITNDRPEVLMHFERDKETLTYKTYEELLEKLKYYLDHEDLLKKVGLAALERCKADHDISSRVDKMLDFLKREGI